MRLSHATPPQWPFRGGLAVFLCRVGNSHFAGVANQGSLSGVPWAFRPVSPFFVSLLLSLIRGTSRSVPPHPQTQSGSKFAKNTLIALFCCGFLSGKELALFADKLKNNTIRGNRTESLQQFRRVTSIGSLPPKTSENPADPRRTPQRPRRTLGETPQSPWRDPRRAL